MAIKTLNSLLTLSAVKTYLQDTGTSYDSRYETLVDYVSSLFNTYTGRKLKSRLYSSTAQTTEDYEYRDGNGTDTIYLHQYPVVSAASEMEIYIDEDRAWSSTADQMTSTDIMIYPDEGRVVIDDDTFSAGDQNVRIKYRAGFTVTSTSSGSTAGTLPPDLDYAAKEMVEFAHRRQQEHRIGMKSQSVDGYNVSYDWEMPYSVRIVLDSYRDAHYG